VSATALAFVDLETTGLNPASDRVKEIGVVTVDGDAVDEWTSILHTGGPLTARLEASPGVEREVIEAAPRFRDIAAGLAARLAGRLFIAHNARFDFSFLRAEFERAGIGFQPQVVCSVMLSRKLYPAQRNHDLDTLAGLHGLKVTVRHRALPDARLLWQFWNMVQRAHPPERVAAAVAELLAGPVLPSHLDPALIDALPAASGIYVFHGENGETLKLGRANNLRWYARDYFRLDRATVKALALSHRVRRISWRRTHGAIGARLRLSVIGRGEQPALRAHAERGLWTWRVTPDASPCVEITPLQDPLAAGRGESSGLFDSPKKALNELRRVAVENSLCFAVLGVPESEAGSCLACLPGERREPCTVGASRLRHLTRALPALRRARVASWPYGGPIGIRERGDVHVVDGWCYLGTAETEGEVQTILEESTPEFDQDVYAYLARQLPRISRRNIYQLTAPRAKYGHE
jgi:DNA polymerase III subunit epsilon